MNQMMSFNILKRGLLSLTQFTLADIVFVHRRAAKITISS